VLHKQDILLLTENVCDHSTCEPCFSVLAMTKTPELPIRSLIKVSVKIYF